MIKVYQTAILILIALFLFPNYALANNNLKMPKVAIALREVTFNLPMEESAILDVVFSIHNPNDINITLIGIIYKIYINGRFIDEKIFIPNPTTLEFLTIPPKETKIERYNPVIYLSSIDEETRNLILSGHGEWSFTGTAVFSTTPDSLSGDLKVPVVTKKTKVRYWGYKFPLPVNLSTITIEVRDENWIPIVGANVTLVSKDASFEGITDEKGSVEFEVPTTNYTIKVFKEGYLPHEEPLELSVPSTLMRAVKLKLATKLIVEVKDETGNPLSDVNITLTSEKGNFTQFTNASGIAKFLIPRAKYTLKIFKEGYLPHEEALDLSTSPTMRKSIQIYHGVKLTVEVKDEEGRPISNAYVDLLSEDVGNFTKTTNASGIAEFEIPRTNYTLRVSKEGYLTYEETLDLSERATSTKVIQLKAKLPLWQKYLQDIVSKIEQYKYPIVGAITICVIIAVIFKLKRKAS